MADSGGIRAGRAFVELGANDAQFRAAIARASASLQALGARIAAVGQRLTAIGASGLVGLGAAANQFQNVGEQLERMSQRTGASVEALSVFRHAASQTGTDLETVEGAMRSVGQALVQAAQGSAEAQDRFLLLGLRARDLAKLHTEDQFAIIAEQLSKISAPATRAARTMEVFGSAALIPMIEKGAKGLVNFREEAERLGLVMSSSMAKQAARMGEDFRRLQMSLQNVAVQIGAALAPTVKDLVDILTPAVARVGQWVNENKGAAVVLAGLATAVTGLGIGLVATGLAISLAGKALMVLTIPFSTLATTMAVVGVTGKVALIGLLAPILMVKAALLKLIALASLPFLKIGAIAGLAAATVAGGAYAMGAFDKKQPAQGNSAQGGQEQVGIMGKIAQTATSAWTQVKSTGMDAWNSVSATAITAWGGITAAIQAGRLDLAIEVISAAIQLEWTKLTNYLQEMWLTAMETISEYWSDARELFNEGVFSMRKAWINTTSYLIGDWESFIGFLEGFWNGFTTGLMESFNAVVDSLKAAWESLSSVFMKISGPIRQALEPMMAFFDSKAGKALLTAGGILVPGVGQAGLIASGVSDIAQGKGLTGTDPAEVEKQRQKRIQEAAFDKVNAQNQIGNDWRAGMGEREKRRIEMENDMVRRKADAEKRLQDAVDAAGKVGAEKQKELSKRADPAALGAFNMKADVQGTFNAAAASMLGGNTVQERILQNGAMQIQKLDEIKKAVKEIGLGPAVS